MEQRTPLDRRKRGKEMDELPPQDNQPPQEPQKPFNDPPQQQYSQQQYPQQPPNEPWQPSPHTSYPPQQPYPSQLGWGPAPQYPPPRPPSKKRFGPLFWILVIGGTLLVCAACSGIGIAILRTPITSSTNESVTQATPSPVVTQSTVTPTLTQSPFTIGEAANTPDGYTVMLNKVYTSPGDEFNTPQPGNQYLVVDVSVKNTTGSNQLMASSQFTLTDNTGQRFDDTIASLPNVHAYVGGTLSNGKTMRGQLVYEVPKGNHPYELAFAANTIYSNYQIVWEIHS
jgi:hypothetical protein